MHAGRTGDTPAPDRSTSPPPTPEQVQAARDWVADCMWKEDPEDIAEYDDATIVRGVQRHYDGGWAQFLGDANLDTVGGAP